MGIFIISSILGVVLNQLYVAGVQLYTTNDSHDLAKLKKMDNLSFSWHAFWAYVVLSWNPFNVSFGKWPNREHRGCFTRMIGYQITIIISHVFPAYCGRWKGAIIDSMPAHFVHTAMFAGLYVSQILGVRKFQVSHICEQNLDCYTILACWLYDWLSVRYCETRPGIGWCDRLFDWLTWI